MRVSRTSIAAVLAVALVVAAASPAWAPKIFSGNLISPPCSTASGASGQLSGQIAITSVSVGSGTLQADLEVVGTCDGATLTGTSDDVAFHLSQDSSRDVLEVFFDENDVAVANAGATAGELDLASPVPTVLRVEGDRAARGLAARATRPNVTLDQVARAFNDYLER